MSEKLEINLHKQFGVSKDACLGVAVSGGVDSMVLLDLMYSRGYDLKVLHCNFNLREAARKDKAFVQKRAEEYDIPFLSKSFDTKRKKQKGGLSTQDAARQLRYKWFNQLLGDGKVDFVLLGHHLDDSVETFFINVLRGTGIGGLSGISSKRDRFLRPMLEYSRNTILEYARDQNIAFREDESNASDNYLRNRIRHHLIPTIQNIQPDFDQRIKNEMNYISAAQALIEDVVEKYKQEHLSVREDIVVMDTKPLDQTEKDQLILFELLKPYGFKGKIIQEILATLQNPGKLFKSESHELNVDRGQLIIRRIAKRDLPTMEITKPLKKVRVGKHVFKLEVLDLRDVVFSTDPFQSLFDMNAIQWPIKVRSWQQGDKIKPLGMKRFKKLSDIFVDQKIPVHEKHQIPVFLSGSEIFWLPGIKESEDFKVMPTTSSVLSIRKWNK